MSCQPLNAGQLESLRAMVRVMYGSVLPEDIETAKWALSQPVVSLFAQALETINRAGCHIESKDPESQR